MALPAASALTEVTTLAGTAHANPAVPGGCPLIRLSAAGRPDPLTAAITHHVTESGSVFLELPDGRLTIVLHLDGKIWIAWRCDEGNLRHPTG